MAIAILILKYATIQLVNLREPDYELYTERVRFDKINNHTLTTSSYCYFHYKPAYQYLRINGFISYCASFRSYP